MTSQVTCPQSGRGVGESGAPAAGKLREVSVRMRGCAFSTTFRFSSVFERMCFLAPLFHRHRGSRGCSVALLMTQETSARARKGLGPFCLSGLLYRPQAELPPLWFGGKHMQRSMQYGALSYVPAAPCALLHHVSNWE